MEDNTITGLIILLVQKTELVMMGALVVLAGIR